MNQNQIPKTPYEQFEVSIKEIFTFEHLPAIIALINHVRPKHESFVKEDEFSTLVYAAKNDAIDELVNRINTFIISNTNLPTHD